MNIQIIDPIQWVKASQARFFPGGIFDVIRLLAYIMADVLELGGGDCRILRRGDWWFVVSDADWLRHELSVIDLFRRVVPAPAHGEHSMRAEVLLGVDAQDVFTVCGGDELLVKGAPPDREQLPGLMRQGDRLVAFRTPIR